MARQSRIQSYSVGSIAKPGNSVATLHDPTIARVCTGRRMKLVPKAQKRRNRVCVQQPYCKCLFCLMRQTLCSGYSAFSKKQLIEFWISTGFGFEIVSLSDLDFEMKLTDMDLKKLNSFLSGVQEPECSSGAGVDFFTKSWCQAKCLTSCHVHMNKSMFYISNTLRNLMIRVLCRVTTS